VSLATLQGPRGADLNVWRPGQSSPGYSAALPEGGSPNGDGRASADAAAGVEPLTWLKQPLENDDGEGADFIIDARPNLSWVVSVTEIETPNELGDFNFETPL
jgi:hypothetical protein